MAQWKSPAHLDSDFRALRIVALKPCFLLRSRASTFDLPTNIQVANEENTSNASLYTKCLDSVVESPSQCNFFDPITIIFSCSPVFHCWLYKQQATCVYELFCPFLFFEDPFPLELTFHSASPKLQASLTGSLRTSSPYHSSNSCITRTVSFITNSPS